MPGEVDRLVVEAHVAGGGYMFEYLRYAVVDILSSRRPARKRIDQWFYQTLKPVKRRYELALELGGQANTAERSERDEQRPSTKVDDGEIFLCRGDAMAVCRRVWRRSEQVNAGIRAENI